MCPGPPGHFPEARVALTLRVVGGLSSEEVARAFLVPVPTVQAHITRGKETIAAAGVPFELPTAGERREWLGSTLSVAYVIFAERSAATSGDRLPRPAVAYEQSGWPEHQPHCSRTSPRCTACWHGAS